MSLLRNPDHPLMLDPQKRLATIRRATDLFRREPGRTGSIVRLDTAEEILVAGDLHGHTHVFARLLRLADLDRHPNRHLVLQEVVHDPRLDPENGLDRSHRLVDLVCALKCQFPDRFHMILGNHELSELTGRSIGKNGVYLNALFRKGIQAAYGEHADAFIAAYRDLFASWPLILRTANRVLLCHTVPNGPDLDRIDLGLLESGSWTPESLTRGGTVYALTWGRDTTAETVDRFSALFDADWIITGHHPCPVGFQQPNHRQLILDGTDPRPTYCLFQSRAPTTLGALVAGVRPVFDNAS